MVHNGPVDILSFPSHTPKVWFRSLQVCTLNGLLQLDILEPVKLAVAEILFETLEILYILRVQSTVMVNKACLSPRFRGQLLNGTSWLINICVVSS